MYTPNNMYSKIIKVSLCFGLVFIGFSAQNISAQQDYTVTKTGGTQISAKEKARLEKQFSGENFHISDDGVVVFTPDEMLYSGNAGNSSDKTEKAAEPKIELEAASNGGSQMIVEHRPISPKSVIKANESQERSGEFVRKDATPISDINIPRSSVGNKVPSESVAENVKSEIPIKITKVISPKENIITGEKPAKKAAFGKRELVSSKYSSLEEAALDIDASLEKLRKEMSSGLPQRVKGGSRNSFGGGAIDNSYSFMDTPETDVDKDKFGSDPSYFINGEQVEKKEYLRLRERNIKSKVIKTQDTVTGNPNGEVWIETKESK